MTVERVRICDLIVSREVMPRAETNWDTVLAYVEAYEAGETFPPIVAFADDDMPERYWLADGWHRMEAQQAPDDEIGETPDPADDRTEIEVEIRSGGKVAAMLCAASANTTHGHRRTLGDAVAAAKVAIRALVLQDPERRPTVEAVKATARVGTDTAQRAFREIELEQLSEVENPPLPPKDPRGGSRGQDFVPRGTNDASPDLDENGMLPVIDLETGGLVDAKAVNVGDQEPHPAHEMAKKIIGAAFAKGPTPGMRMMERENQATIHNHCFGMMQQAVREALAIPAEEAAESWRIAGRTNDLAEILEGVARDIAAYAAAVRAAKPQRLRLVKAASEAEVRR